MHQFLQGNIGSGSECTVKCVAGVNNQIKASEQNGSSSLIEGVSVDEACYFDFTNFENEHPDWTALYAPSSKSDASACGTDTSGTAYSKGNFVAVQGSVIATNNFYLTPRPKGADQMRLTCEETSAFWICTVHLPYLDETVYPDVHKDEISEIASDVETKLSGDVVVCGDFNMTPGDAAFAPFKAANDNFQETDPTNSPTTNPKPGKTGNGVKFDYIWYHKANDANVSSVSGTVIQQPTTGTSMKDHNLLQGSVTW